MDIHYTLKRRWQFVAIPCLIIAMMMVVNCYGNGVRASSALEVLCCDSKVGPFKFHQERLIKILEKMSSESRAEWCRRGMSDGLKIEFSGNKEWLDQTLSVSVEESPILTAFLSLEEITNSNVMYSDGVISIQEQNTSKEDVLKKYEQFRNILSATVIEGGVYDNILLIDLLQRIYEKANIQLSKNGCHSMGLACSANTNTYFRSIYIPSSSIYGVFQNLAERVGAKVEYDAGNIVFSQTNDVAGTAEQLSVLERAKEGAPGK